MLHGSSSREERDRSVQGGITCYTPCPTASTKLIVLLHPASASYPPVFSLTLPLVCKSLLCLLAQIDGFITVDMLL